MSSVLSKQLWMTRSIRKFIAARGLCWRKIFLTDSYHFIAMWIINAIVYLHLWDKSKWVFPPWNILHDGNIDRTSVFDIGSLCLEQVTAWAQKKLQWISSGTRARTHFLLTCNQISECCNEKEASATKFTHQKKKSRTKRSPEQHRIWCTFPKFSAHRQNMEPGRPFISAFIDVPISNADSVSFTPNSTSGFFLQCQKNQNLKDHDSFRSAYLNSQRRKTDTRQRNFAVDKYYCSSTLAKHSARLTWNSCAPEASKHSRCQSFGWTGAWALDHSASLSLSFGSGSIAMFVDPATTTDNPDCESISSQHASPQTLSISLESLRGLSNASGRKKCNVEKIRSGSRVKSYFQFIFGTLVTDMQYCITVLTVVHAVRVHVKPDHSYACASEPLSCLQLVAFNWEGLNWLKSASGVKFRFVGQE